MVQPAMADSKPPKVWSPHDSLFRTTFQQPALAVELLQSALPVEVADAIDWSSLRVESHSTTDDKLQWRHTDLLFRAQFRQGDPLLVFVIVEHQSSRDGLMAYRMLRYLVRALDHYLEGLGKEVSTLPPVLPLVVSHAEGTWSAPTEVLELFRTGDAELDARLSPFLPKFQYVLDDLSAQTAEAVAGRELGPEAKLTLLALRQARVKFFAGMLKAHAALLQHLQQAPGGIEKTARFLHYVLNVGDDTPEALRDVLHHHIGPEAGEVVMSTAERLREEGHQQGVEQGRLAERRETLVRQLHLRFPEVDVDVIQSRVSAATGEQLLRWADHIVVAQSFEDVFTD